MNKWGGMTFLEITFLQNIARIKLSNLYKVKPVALLVTGFILTICKVLQLQIFSSCDGICLKGFILRQCCAIHSFVQFSNIIRYYHDLKDAFFKSKQTCFIMTKTTFLLKIAIGG